MRTRLTGWASATIIAWGWLGAWCPGQAPSSGDWLTLKLSDFAVSPQIAYDATTGGCKLAHSVLLTDEIGATDWLQTEPLSDTIQAKKIFVLDSADVTDAELFFFGTAKHVEVNGEKATGIERLPSTGWTRAKLPRQALGPGANDVRIWGAGSLLVEPSKQPGRSFKSTDGGRTWSREHLTAKGTVQGEYLVRLRLGRYAPRGWALSPVIDLWEGKNGIGTPRAVTGFEVHPFAKQPRGTQAKVLLRTGSTPTPDDKTWTRWSLADQQHVPEEKGHRWAQVKIELSTNAPQETPRVYSQLFVRARGTSLLTTTGPATLKTVTPAPALSGVPFVYEGPSPRLKFLREKYKLDDVIAPGKTEMEQLMLLRYWVRNQWHTAWKSHPAGWMPPWDSLIILQNRDLPDCLTMCTHYACVFTQCAQALGWNARHCILDHHCVSEVYVNQHDAWVMMDTGNSPARADVGLHFQVNGRPLSAAALHVAHRTGKTRAIEVCFTPQRLAAQIVHLCRPAPAAPKEPRPDTIPLSELANYPVCQIENYRRYAFPPRNTFLTSLYPGELYQGYSEYYYDGYYWVGDSPDDPKTSPEYSLHLDPTWYQQIDWKLNCSRIHLSYSKNPDELQVDLATHTPNLARLEMRRETNGKRLGEWQTTPASFIWKLESGENTLVVRSVNHWGKAGSESRAVVSYSK